MVHYFKTDSRKLTFGEYWNFTPRGNFPPWRLCRNDAPRDRGGPPNPQPAANQLFGVPPSGGPDRLKSGLQTAGSWEGRTCKIWTHPSPCPLPARWGEGGRRPGEGRFMGTLPAFRFTSRPDTRPRPRRNARTASGVL